MAKPDSWIPLRIEPWRKKTARLSPMARSAYLDLLLAYWQGEELPADDNDALTRLARCTEAEWKQVRSKVLAFFKRDGEFLTQDRADDEKAEAKQRYANKASAGKAGGKASGKKRRSKPEADEEANNEAKSKQDTKQQATQRTLEHSPEGESPHKSPKGNQYPKEFLDFCKAYPSRGKAANPKSPAFKKWKKAIKDGVDPQILIAAAARYKTDMGDKDGTEFVVQMVRWFSEKRWTDTTSEDASQGTDEPPPDLKGWRLAAWKSMGASPYKSWIEPATVSRNSEVVIFCFLTNFRADYFRDHHAHNVLRIMQAEDNTIGKIQVEVAPAGPEEPANEDGLDIPNFMRRQA